MNVAFHRIFSPVKAWLSSRRELLSEKALTPRLREEHRQFLIQRSRAICWIIVVLVPFTNVIFDYFFYPEAVLGSIVVSGLCALVALLLLFSLRTDFIQKHYNLPLFILLGGIGNFAATANLQLTGGGNGFFFFPYFLIYLAIGIFYPGSLRWVLATCMAVFCSYIGSEWLMGRDLASTQIAANLFYLLNLIALGFFANRIYYGYFIRDKRSQIELEAANERLKELDQAKSDFFANVSHELKTPMTLVLSPLENVLTNGSSEADVLSLPQNTFQTVYHNSHRLATMIENLIDLTRGEVGGARLQAVHIPNPTEYFEAVCLSLKPLFEEKQIRYSLEVASALKPHLFDQEKIDRVLVNLISNAAKFTPNGGEVRVRFWDEGELLKVSVEDTGIGIPKDKQAEIFERFMQVDASSTRVHSGMGIGLSLVKDFVEQHGGTVGVESEPGQGTTIFFTLPRGREHFTVPEVDVSIDVLKTIDLNRQILALRGVQKRESSTAELPMLEKDGDSEATILIVDDHPGMRDAVREVLTGFRTFSARDGREGLKIAQRIKPDLIISDIMMPNKDGYSLVADVKNHPVLKEIPIILLTAKAGEESLVHGFSMGADDYIMKPFQPKELLARVRNLLKIREQEKELRSHRDHLEQLVQERGAELIKTNEQLQREVVERVQAQAQIQASLQEKEVMLKEIHHRVKNNLQVISSLLNLQAGYLNDPETLEMFKTTQDRVKSMAMIHERLYQSEDLGQIHFGEYIRELATHLFHSYQVNTYDISLEIHVEEILLDINAAIPCGLIVNELVSNALKHAFPASTTGEIHIEFSCQNETTCTLIVSDTGVGFPADLDFRNTDSLGLQLVNTLTDQLEGKIELHQAHSTAFEITFAPLKSGG